MDLLIQDQMDTEITSDIKKVQVLFYNAFSNLVHYTQSCSRVQIELFEQIDSSQQTSIGVRITNNKILNDSNSRVDLDFVKSLSEEDYYLKEYNLKENHEIRLGLKLCSDLHQALSANQPMQITFTKECFIVTFNLSKNLQFLEFSKRFLVVGEPQDNENDFMDKRLEMETLSEEGSMNQIILQRQLLAQQFQMDYDKLNSQTDRRQYEENAENQNIGRISANFIHQQQIIDLNKIKLALKSGQSGRKP